MNEWRKSQLITQKETADLFGVTTRTLRNWVACGELPEPIKIGRRRFYTKEMIDSALLPA